MAEIDFSLKGEPQSLDINPALLNVIFAATGKWIYRLPTGGFD